jgi:hypothetical protein
LQGKALALLLGIAAGVILAACGDQSASSQPASGGSTVTSEGNGAAKLQHFKRRVASLQVERERKSQAQPRDANPPSAAPTVVHHDSGGGAAQFRTKGGDNSIQESGVEASAAERERAAGALHAYLDLRRAHNWPAACHYLSASLIVLLERAVELSPRRASPEGCPAILAAMSKAVPQRLLAELTEVDVGSLRKNGERGFLLYHGPGGQDYVMNIVEEAGGWKMGNLDGVVLP